MNKFNDKIYLLLTLKKDEFLMYYLQSIALILAVSVYNLIGVFLKLPQPVSYYSLVFAFILVSALYLYLWANLLPIDWKLLEAVEELPEEEPNEGGESEATEPEGVEATLEEKVEENTNQEIKLVEPGDIDFDFTDSLASLYKTGTSKQLSDVGAKGIEQKVRHMNLR